jgi:hypothetical protein
MFRPAHGLESVLDLRRGGASSAIAPGRHLEAWRATAMRVWMCWDALLASEPEDRGRAFAACMAALDEEAGAAADMAVAMTMRSGMGA